MFELIKNLTEMRGPVGFEGEVSDFVCAEWKAAGAEVRRTAVGNVVAHLGGRGPKLVIDAHLDEISLLVKSITDDGFLLVTLGTGQGENDLPPNVAFYLHEVMVGSRDGYVPGFIGAATGHVRTGRQRRKTEIEWDDVFVDIGAVSRAEVEEMGIRPGCPVILDSKTRRVGRYIQGKAMDTRACLAQMITFAREYDRAGSGYDVYLSATVMEEIGVVGAWSVGHSEFDLAVCLEVGLAGDIPTVGTKQVPVSLGKGPILVHKDSGVHYDERILAGLERAAALANVPVQHAVFYGFNSDGSAFIKRGIPAALFAFPARYTHTANETCSLDDLEAMVRILHEFCRQGA